MPMGPAWALPGAGAGRQRAACLPACLPARLHACLPARCCCVPRASSRSLDTPPACPLLPPAGVWRRGGSGAKRGDLFSQFLLALRDDREGDQYVSFCKARQAKTAVVLFGFGWSCTV